MKKKKPTLRTWALLLALSAATLGIFWLGTHRKPAHRPSPPVTVSVYEEAHPPEETAFLSPSPPAPAPPVPPGSARHAKPRIALVIDDMGLDRVGSARATRLPKAVTLSWLPYAPHLAAQVRAATGHEALLHLPMEPIGHDNPGPEALLTSLSSEEIQRRVQKALDSFADYDGVNNHMGSKFTADADKMALVAEALRIRGLYFLDSRTSARSVGLQIAEKYQVPSVGRDVFLDDTVEASAIRAQLEQTERIARRKGYAIAIGHPHTATLEALETWIPEAEAKGFELVPLRTLVSMRK